MDNIKSLVKHARKLASNKSSMPNFYEYVRRIECIHKNLERVGNAVDINSEAVRFAQVPHLHFPASDIESVSVLAKSHEQVLINQYFFGLLGANGPMPLEFTSYVINRSNNYYDKTTQKFLDIINNRMLTLYYKAWAYNEQAVDYDRENGLISKIIGALTGSVSDIYYDKNDIMSENFEKSYSRFLSTPIRSKDGLEKILKAYFHIPVRVIPNIETKHSIPKKYYCKLGNKETCVLGRNIQIGKNYLSNSKKIRIEFEVESFRQCQKLLPGTSEYEKITYILNTYLNAPMEYKIKYIIKKDTTQQSILSGTNALGMGIVLKNNKDKPYDIVIMVNGYSRSVNQHKNSYNKEL